MTSLFGGALIRACSRGGGSEESRCLLKFRLHDVWRIAEPHDYGMRGGAPQLLVYQGGGKSRSGRLPAWRWVVLGHASDFEVLDETFAGSRNAEARHHVAWDKVFARVE